MSWGHSFPGSISGSYAQASEICQPMDSFFGDTSCQNSDGLFIPVFTQAAHSTQDTWNSYEGTQGSRELPLTSHHNGFYSTSQPRSSELWRDDLPLLRTRQQSALDNWTTDQDPSQGWTLDLPPLPRSTSLFSQDTPGSTSTSRQFLADLLNPSVPGPTLQEAPQVPLQTQPPSIPLKTSGPVEITPVAPNSESLTQTESGRSPLFSPLPPRGSSPGVGHDGDWEDDNDVNMRSELLKQQDDSTHVQRLGPGARVQPAARANRRLTDAEKATQALAREANKTKRAAFMLALDSAATEYDERLSNIAHQHGYTIDYIKNLIGHSSHFKPKREPSLYNMMQHVMAARLAKGMLRVFIPSARATNFITAGIKTNGPQDLKKRIEESEEFQNPTPEQIQSWREQLHEHRKTSMLGARVDNKSAAIDYQATLKRMHHEVSNGLSIRTLY